MAWYKPIGIWHGSSASIHNHRARRKYCCSAKVLLRSVTHRSNHPLIDGLWFILTIALYGFFPGTIPFEAPLLLPRRGAMLRDVTRSSRRPHQTRTLICLRLNWIWKALVSRHAWQHLVTSMIMFHTPVLVHFIIRGNWGLVVVISDSDSAVFFIRLLRVRIRYDDDLTQDLIQLVPSSLFITSPLDEDVEAQSLDHFPGILPGGLLEKLIIPCVGMSNMCDNSKLNPSGQRHFKTQAYRFGTLIHRRLCSSQHATAQELEPEHPYQIECMCNDGLTVRIRDAWE